TVTAQLVDRRRYQNSNLRHFLDLVLRVDDHIFPARWESENAADWKLETGSYVRITGVNDAAGSRNREQGTFKLLLRSPEDVVPVPAPPVWMRKDFQRIAAVAGGVAFLAGGWILLLRWQMRRLEHRVADRTAEL